MIENTMLIQLTDERADGIICELERLQLIKILKENIVPSEVKPSERYRGVFSKEDAESFERHTLYMRGR